MAGLDIYSLTKDLYQTRIERKMAKDFREIERLEDIDRRRPEHWKETIQRMYEQLDYVIFGAGFQNFGNLNVGASAAHNVYLHVLAELGIVGFLIFSAWLLALRRSLANLRKSNAPLYFQLVYPASACYVNLLVLGLFNETLYPSRAIPGFMGFALAYFAVVMHRKWLDSDSPGDNSSIDKQKVLTFST